jgi:glycogen operon protein
MVKALHAAGLEVILDVVYNHTAEGNNMGPVFSFKGFDNAAYYRISDDPRHYMDYTGTGNSLDTRHPFVVELIMDSLRYWVQEMHVDGFRFDLTTTLIRGTREVDAFATFLTTMQQDPVLREVKLIAEPWDLGADGYQLGRFPSPWREWNGRFRDSVRDYWRGTDGLLGELAQRLTGSSDLYEGSGRRPLASLNFITAHDGFTLRDLVSYDHKHNEANGEDNRDGEHENRSCNHGAEGPTDDPGINALRARQQRNLLCTLMLAQGVPMLLAGDEIGRSQQGNNNAYCQDNELSWIDWTQADEGLRAFTQRLIRLRRAHPVFRRDKWLHGEAPEGAPLGDVAWFGATGDRLPHHEWSSAHKALVMFLNGTTRRTGSGEPAAITDSFVLCFNADGGPVQFTLPPAIADCPWQVVIDTGGPDLEADRPLGGTSFELAGRSFVLLRCPAEHAVLTWRPSRPRRHTDGRGRPALRRTPPGSPGTNAPA